MSGHSAAHPRETVDRIIARLQGGNARFVSGAERSADSSPELRTALTCGQSPVAAVLACSDSRVVPEMIFDQGLGSLFVVRVAGNVVDDIVLASLEYAVQHLGVPLILVMGHSRCGAVTSACACSLDLLEGATGVLLEAIEPAVQLARSRGCSPDDLVDLSAEMNVRAQIDALLESPVVRETVDQGRLTLQGAWYDLETGRVEWI